MSRDAKALEKFIMDSHGGSRELDDIVYVFNEYMRDMSSDLIPTEVVEIGSSEMDSKFNPFNEFCSKNNITPLQVAAFMAYNRSRGHDPLHHFETADYAIIDRDGILGGENYEIAFPTNNELKKLIASYAEEMFFHFEGKDKAGEIADCHPVKNIFAAVKKLKEAQR